MTNDFSVWCRLQTLQYSLMFKLMWIDAKSIVHKRIYQANRLKCIYRLKEWVQMQCSLKNHINFIFCNYRRRIWFTEITHSRKSTKKNIQQFQEVFFRLSMLLQKPELERKKGEDSLQKCNWKPSLFVGSWCAYWKPTGFSSVNDDIRESINFIWLYAHSTLFKGAKLYLPPQLTTFFLINFRNFVWWSHHHTCDIAIHDDKYGDNKFFYLNVCRTEEQMTNFRPFILIPDIQFKHNFGCIQMSRSVSLFHLGSGCSS